MNAYSSESASNLARMGRHGDTHLLHVSSDELHELARLGHLTRNPKTGLPEAFSLGSVFHSIGNAITNPAALIGGALGGGVGGLTGATAAGNAITGQPIGTGLQGAAGTDIAGLGAGMALGGSLGAGLGMAARGAGMANAPAAGGMVNAPAAGTTGAGILGGGLSLAGSNENLKAYEEAQRNAEAAGKFTPYNVYSGMGSTTFGPNGVTSSLSPQYQGLQGSLLSNAAGALGAGAQDPQTLANNYYGLLQKQASPYEAQDRANALAQLQATGTSGLGVGGDALSGPSNPLYSSLLRAQSDAALQRQIQAQTMSQSVANSTQQRGLGYLNAGAGLDQLGLQNAQLGGQLGALQTQGALGGARLAQPAILGQGATKGGMLGGLGSGAAGTGGVGGLLGSFGGPSGIANAFGSGLSSLGGSLGSLFGGSNNSIWGTAASQPLGNAGLDSITNAGDFGLAGF